MQGLILLTTDAGENWKMDTIESAVGFWTVDFVNVNIGYVTGNSKIFKTTNSGDSWFELGNANSSQDAFFCNDTVGTIVGGYNIARTNDGGLSWGLQFQGLSNYLTGVVFSDLNNGIVVGENGVILRTSNGGQTWNYEFSGTYNLLWSVDYLGANTYVVVGEGGTILKTTTGGTVWVNEEPNEQNIFPDEIDLHQNYPNPFNPSTTIRYTVHKQNFVNLKIFNSLGQEIETLVSEEKSKGDYKIVWNASGKESGAYFYRLQIGDKVKTKKLVLLK
jgi:photosystem II stability/assembly factor-like uncharacterized protein